MEKILAVSFPPITSYSHHATCLSIISCNDKYLPWFFSNYIQLIASADLDLPTSLDFYVGTAPWLAINSYSLLNCPFLIRETLPRNINDRKDIVDIFIDCIDNGFYIYTEVEGFYIKPYAAYQSFEFMHPIFIYGYNKEKKFFYTADFFVNGIFKFEKCSFEDIKKGYEEIPGYNWGIELYKYNGDVEVALNKELIIGSLEDYLHSKRSSPRYRCDLTFGLLEEKIYGVDTLKRIQTEIQMQKEGEYIIDYRVLPVLLDHKKFMRIMIQNLMQQKIIQQCTSLSDTFLGIEDKVTVVRNMYLRYFITKNKLLLNEIESRFSTFVGMEESAMESLIKQLLK
ncbi:hypothetical protein [Cohnella silvisoli]|uniref:Butirosin biosynthesis protein H N-terminal domain-containing protein n=1 Tax=Cohnella silvisoli TaxID=2873699 RepID=A0ABV1KTC1_9BACL|nr:hypothetical protein [Cohnella silvisoli]MCD9021531.1 hypothetical protein [Cohnella silvisoli]